MLNWSAPLSRFQSTCCHCDQRLRTITDFEMSATTILHDNDSFLYNAINMTFVERLSLAWKIIFPSPTMIQNSNANIAKQRLKMILFSDRCAVSDEAKQKIVSNVVNALQDFVVIEPQDKVQLSVSTDPTLGTIYSVTVPVRRVRAEYQEEDEAGTIVNVEYKDNGKISGSVDDDFQVVEGLKVSEEHPRYCQAKSSDIEEKLVHLMVVVKFKVLIEKKKMCSLGLMRFDWLMEFLMVHLEELEMKNRVNKANGGRSACMRGPFAIPIVIIVKMKGAWLIEGRGRRSGVTTSSCATILSSLSLLTSGKRIHDTIDTSPTQEAIRGMQEQLLGVPIQEELTALRFRVDITEAENASLRARIKTKKEIEKITRSQERRARMEMERQLASVQESQRQDRENFRKLQ
nr:cell division topological specificity factor homolog, chloroplastic [Tanacetum cinerariifolium]